MQEKAELDKDLIEDDCDEVAVLGHTQAYEIMLKAFLSNKMPSSWLLQGPKGIGKAALGYKLASRILLEGSLPSKRSAIISQIKQNYHPDFLVVSRETDEDSINSDAEIKVDQIRKINEFLSLAAGISPYRVILIDGVDYLNSNASNALLKILEEPPANVFFLLINHNPKLILPTINSRCVKLKLRRLNDEEFVTVVQRILPDLKPEQFNILKTYSYGCPGIALSLSGADIFTILPDLIAILEDYPQVNMGKVQEFVDKILQVKSDTVFTSTLYILYVVLFRLMQNSQIPIGKESINSIENKLFNLNPNIRNLLPRIQDLGKKVTDRGIVYLDKRSFLLSLFAQL